MKLLNHFTQRSVISNYRIVIFSFLLLTFVCGFTGVTLASSWPYQDETPAQRDARMAWWRQARFGMFIHWGIYAVPAGTYNDEQVRSIGEWIMNYGKIPVADYKEYAKQFNPVKYDPDQWVQLAKDAGMKYIVITAKHHDGFALFDSKVTDWDVVDATPYGKDLLKPLAEACQKHGIKLGFYYSQAQDWCHPGGSAIRRMTKDGWDNPNAEAIDEYAAKHRGHWDPAQEGSMDEYIQNIAAPQVKEILTNYGNIAVLWWDTPSDMTVERADMLQPLISLQPGIITNNRLGGEYPGDTETPEQHIPATGYKNRDWETCMTMNTTWGFKSYDHDWKSTEMMIRNLVDIASKGGNYLLNVGPTAKGEIPQPSIERLKEIGEWMKINSESIYETTASPFARLTWGRCTKKTFINGATLYLHVFDWPKDGKLFVPGLKNQVQQTYLLANTAKLKTINDEDGVIIHLPAEPLDEINTVIVLKVVGPLNIQKVLPKQDEKGAVLLTAELADIHNPGYGQHAKLESRSGKHNIGYWSDARTRVEWPFVIREKGKFTVTAEIAIEAPESALEVVVGSQSIKTKVQSTGGYEKFKTVTLGQTDLLEAGTYKLQIKPQKGQWLPINLRRVVLVPTE